jgi:hypothetical protein
MHPARQHRAIWSSCGLLTLLLSTALLAPSINAGPVCGIHTIQADDRALSLICETGCSWVVQLFNWSEIEPLPGEYFWEYPDMVLRACQYYGLNLAVRIDHPPDWALSEASGGLPVDKEAYAAFAAHVAERYKGQVRAYIVWNEPNLSSEWGSRPPDPAAYVELLRAASSAIRQADPRAWIVSAGLAPTNRVDETAIDDRFYLRGMYEAGASRAFDILGSHPYGFAFPPDDPRGAHQGLNLSRLEELRQIMVDYGDAHKAVWATEVGWTTEAVDDEHSWLEVSEEQQALYLKGTFDKARRDWPWLEMIVVWNLSIGLPAEDEKRGYSIVNDDYSPRPAYVAVSTMPKRWAPRRVDLGKGQNGVQILAPDVTVRLGDVDTLHPHWVHIYGGRAPCRQWVGDFYVERPGKAAWQLTMEIMQVEEQGNVVMINGQPLNPMTIPLRGKPDFASSWSTAFLDVPAQVLRAGHNAIEIAASPRLGGYQDSHSRFESLQFRNVRLVQVG